MDHNQWTSERIGKWETIGFSWFGLARFERKKTGFERKDQTSGC